MKKTLAIILSVFILFSILPVIPFTASAIAIEETYYDYDEIDYSDLLLSGDHLAMETAINGSKTFTYNRTSPTGSVILRYRWTVGSVAKFQLSFEKTASNAMAYMFGAWLSEPSAEANYPNGRMWLRPGYGPPVAIENVIEPGTDHDIELARLKVANGSNKGKYYVYIKIDGELIAEDYVVASIVDADLNYYSKPNEVLCSIPSNEIFFAFWGSENNKISSASAKYSGLENCSEILAKSGAQIIRQTVLKMPPKALAVVESPRARPGCLNSTAIG